MSARSGRLIVAAVLAVVVVLLAVVANRPGTDRFDQVIEVRVHHWMVAHPPWPRIAQVTGQITQPFVVRILAVLLAIGLFIGRRRREGLWLFGTVATGSLAVVLLKLVFARPRPVWPDPIAVASGYAFPSSHAVHAAIAAGCTIALLDALSRHPSTGDRPGPAQPRPPAPRWIIAVRAGAVLVALATGADRVMLGVHYPSDVLAGWAIGAFIVLVLWDLLMQPPQRAST